MNWLTKNSILMCELNSALRMLLLALLLGCQPLSFGSPWSRRLTYSNSYAMITTTGRVMITHQRTGHEWCKRILTQLQSRASQEDLGPFSACNDVFNAITPGESQRESDPQAIMGQGNAKSSIDSVRRGPNWAKLFRLGCWVSRAFPELKVDWKIFSLPKSH